MPNKKAVELTMNTIIIAIIVLLVLVVLAYLLFKGSSGFNTGTACYQAGGSCKSSDACTAVGGTPIYGDAKNPNYGCGSQYCCKVS